MTRGLIEHRNLKHEMSQLLSYCHVTISRPVSFRLRPLWPWQRPLPSQPGPVMVSLHLGLLALLVLLVLLGLGLLALELGLGLGLWLWGHCHALVCRCLESRHCISLVCKTCHCISLVCIHILDRPHIYGRNWRADFGGLSSSDSTDYATSRRQCLRQNTTKRVDMGCVEKISE